jgi:hypothetical protein
MAGTIRRDKAFPQRKNLAIQAKRRAPALKQGQKDRGARTIAARNALHINALANLDFPVDLKRRAVITELHRLIVALCLENRSC